MFLTTAVVCVPELLICERFVPRKPYRVNLLVIAVRIRNGGKEQKNRPVHSLLANAYELRLNSEDNRCRGRSGRFSASRLAASARSHMIVDGCQGEMCPPP